MTDLFKSEEAAKLLNGKTVLFLGASVTRGLYKDLIWLLNSNTLLPRKILGQKGEASFPDFSQAGAGEFKDKFKFQDQLQDDFFGLNRGRDYRETREYINDDHDIKICFKFITEAWSEDIFQWINTKETQFGKIDIIIMNSCLWDVNRRGPTYKEIYEEKLNKLVDTMKNKFPNTQLYWMTTPPVAEETNSKGMRLPGLFFQNYTTCFNVVEANKLAGEIMKEARINVIDVNYALQAQTRRRNPDGIHWSSQCNRLMTHITLTHLTLTLPHFGPEDLPGRIKNASLTNLIQLAEASKSRIREEKEFETWLLY